LGAPGARCGVRGAPPARSIAAGGWYNHLDGGLPVLVGVQFGGLKAVQFGLPPRFELAPACSHQINSHPTTTGVRFVRFPKLFYLLGPCLGQVPATGGAPWVPRWCAGGCVCSQTKRNQMSVFEDPVGGPISTLGIYGWTGQEPSSGFSDLTPSILHYNWF
jgi:hypothetical protein